MSTNKSSELKTFLRTARRKVGKGVFSAPVWVMQKTGERLYNKKAKRTWDKTSFGHEFGNKKGD